MSTGARLKVAREKVGLTLQHVADVAAVDLRTYQRFEADERLPRVDVAIKIAAALGVTVEKLFGEK